MVHAEAAGCDEIVRQSEEIESELLSQARRVYAGLAALAGANILVD
jgi:hypothetical protein